MILPKHELDKACKDTQHISFPRDFALSLRWHPIRSRETGESAQFSSGTRPAPQDTYQRGLQLAKRAVTADHSKNKSQAVELYRAACEALIDSLEHHPEKRKQAIMGSIRSYIQRGTKLDPTSFPTSELTSRLNGTAIPSADQTPPESPAVASTAQVEEKEQTAKSPPPRARPARSVSFNDEPSPRRGSGSGQKPAAPAGGPSIPSSSEPSPSRPKPALPPGGPQFPSSPPPSPGRPKPPPPAGGPPISSTNSPASPPAPVQTGPAPTSPSSPVFTNPSSPMHDID